MRVRRNMNVVVEARHLPAHARDAAASMRDHSRRVFAAVSITGPVQRVGDKALQHFAAEAVSTGRSISQRFGYRPPRAGAGQQPIDLTSPKDRPT